jgi:hypothetical protein
MSYAGDVGAIFRYVTTNLWENRRGGKNTVMLRGHGGRLGALKPPAFGIFLTFGFGFGPDCNRRGKARSDPRPSAARDSVNLNEIVNLGCTTVSSRRSVGYSICYSRAEI